MTCGERLIYGYTLKKIKKPAGKGETGGFTCEENDGKHPFALVKAINMPCEAISM
jgi:hypothetical protein